METVPAITSFSIEDIASEARRMNIINRALMLTFAGQAAFWVLLTAGLWYVEGAMPALSTMLIFLGAAAVSAVFAYMYLLAGRQPEEFDWTLASRISSEKRRVARQIAMITRVPTHFLLPLFAIVLVGIIVDYTDKIGMTTLLIRVGLFTLFAGLAIAFVYWMTKRSEQQELRPFLEKMKQLEQQLEDS